MYKCASFFAGVGGIDMGFKNAGFEIVYANEFDKNASITYNANHNLEIDCRDIREVKCEEIPDFDIMLAGFPCQPFSVAGYREGFDDRYDRGNLFFELERIFSVKKPKIIFLENVKNLYTHDNGNTFKVILEILNKNGYFVKHAILNSRKHGNIPQNRERIYIVAFLNEKACEKFEFPREIDLTVKIKDVIDVNQKVDKKYYYDANFNHYSELADAITKDNTIYQWRRRYVRENKNNVCPTLTANMGTGGHNVPLILTKYGIRKLTPKECFLFQGYPENFILPTTVSNGNLYKQAGNSVTVPVIQKIAENIINATKNLKKD